MSSRGCLDERLRSHSASGGTTSIERGEGNLTLRSVERLADGVGVDVHVLIAENETVLAGEAT